MAFMAVMAQLKSVQCAKTHTMTSFWDDRLLAWEGQHGRSGRIVKGKKCV